MTACRYKYPGFFKLSRHALALIASRIFPPINTP
jgi:hypothetical protein